MTKLLDAIITYKPNEVKEAMSYHGCDVNGVETSGAEPPLVVAVYINLINTLWGTSDYPINTNIEIIKLLLEKNADIFLKGPSGWSAIDIASTFKLKIKKMLLKKSIKNIFNAIESDSKELLQLSVRPQIDLNIKYDYYKSKKPLSALSFALSRGKLSLATILIENYARISKKDKSALEFMKHQYMGYLEENDKETDIKIVKYELEKLYNFLQKSAEYMNLKYYTTVDTELLSAVHQRDYNRAEKIALVCDNINLQLPISGKSALSLAVTESQESLVKKLLRKNANPNFIFRSDKKDRFIRKTPLTEAISSLNLNIVNILLQNGANPNFTDNKDSIATPIVTAIFRVIDSSEQKQLLELSHKIVLSLLKAGAKIVKSFKTGLNAFLLACENKINFIIEQFGFDLLQHTLDNNDIKNFRRLASNFIIPDDVLKKLCKTIKNRKKWIFARILVSCDQRILNISKNEDNISGEILWYMTQTIPKVIIYNPETNQAAKEKKSSSQQSLA